MINSFQKNYSNKLTATFLAIIIASSIAKPTIKFSKPTSKQKNGHLAKNEAIKQA